MASLSLLPGRTVPLSNKSYLTTAEGVCGTFEVPLEPPSSLALIDCSNVTSIDCSNVTSTDCSNVPVLTAVMLPVSN